MRISAAARIAIAVSSIHPIGPQRRRKPISGEFSTLEVEVGTREASNPTQTLENFRELGEPPAQHSMKTHVWDLLLTRMSVAGRG